MEITENILIDRQRYLINLLIENTESLSKIKNLNIKGLHGKDEKTNIGFEIKFSKFDSTKSKKLVEDLEKNDSVNVARKVLEDYGILRKPITYNAAFKEDMIKEAEKNFKKFENKFFVETSLDKKLTDFKYLEDFEWMKFADKVTPEYIDALHQQIIEKNKEVGKNIETKQNKVVLAIFDLSDMD